jgi:hypothetical protein
MAPNGYRAREEDRQESQHKDDHQQSNQGNFGLRVAKIQSPSYTVALFDKQSRIIGIAVKESPVPVPIIIAENGGSRLTIIRCVRFSLITLGMPEHDEDEDNQ